jgi:nucleoside-diphosphate-sugar epimerase
MTPPERPRAFPADRGTMEGVDGHGPILVAGGGFIGRAVVRRLAREDQDVAVLTAHPSRSAAAIQQLGARVVRGDVLEPATLPAAMSGVRAVVQALTFPTFPVEKPSRRFTFEEFDHLGTDRLVRAAAEAGVERFVFTSGSGAAPDAPTQWHRAKWRGEEAVRVGGVGHAIVRPSWVYGPEDRALNRFVTFHRRLPFVPVVGDGRQRLQPVFVDDVAEVLARAASTDGPAGTFEAGGPDVLTMDQVLTAMMDARGRRKPLVHVPMWMPKLAGAVVRWLPDPPLSPAAVDFLTGDAVADTGPLLESFAIRLTPLGEGLATYLAPGPTGA